MTMKFTNKTITLSWEKTNNVQISNLIITPIRTVSINYLINSVPFFQLNVWEKYYDRSKNTFKMLLLVTIII